MKRDGLLKPALVAFGIAAIVYFIAYTAIEHRRTRRGPWQVTFTLVNNHVPALVISQPSLALTNVEITFPGQKASADPRTILSFRDPRPVPYAVPFGTCIFMDTTFLPGTVVFNLFGHEIQLLPRVLTIDKREQPWRSNETLAVPESADRPR